MVNKDEYRPNNAIKTAMSADDTLIGSDGLNG